MKQIQVNGRNFYYDVRSYSVGSGGISETRFYDGTRTRQFRKWVIFGKYERIEVGEGHVFTIYMDIESPLHTKQEIRDAVERAIKVLDRQDEIAKGEII